MNFQNIFMTDKISYDEPSVESRILGLIVQPRIRKAMLRRHVSNDVIKYKVA